VALTASAQPEAIIEKFISTGKVPGVFVGVVRGDSVLFQKSFGTADKKVGTPMSDATCMELGSISKVFTAETIYSLHSARLLNIQDPIRKYLPAIPASWSKITIQHLLQHTSGIQNYLLDARFKAGAYFTNQKDTSSERFFNTVSSDSMFRLLYDLPLEFKPGFTWSYSNTGYYLLGKIGEAVTGKPFFQLVEEQVIAPLQMNHTFANEVAAEKNCLSKGYFLRDTSLHESRVLHSNYAFSAGAWAATGLDMIRFLKAIHRRELPSDKAGLDWRKAPDMNTLPFTYNSGRFYTSFHGMDILSHNGGTPGFSSSWIYVVEKNTSIIILMNRQDYAPVDKLAWDILSFFEPSLKYPKKKRSGNAEKKITQNVRVFINALKTDSPFPKGLSKPLEHLLNSENGKGYWKWYFDRGYPTSVICVDVEPIRNAKLYRFLLRSANKVVYQLAVVENEKGELTQIRWW
jgi:CubicO group peptidase (beta-lactamase class C family)